MSSDKRLHSRLEGLFTGLARPQPAVAQAVQSSPPAAVDVLAVVPGWTWELDGSGVFTACSPDVTAFLGYSAGEMVGRPLSQIIAATDPAAARELVDALARRQPLADLLLALTHKDGSTVLGRLSALPKLDDSGDLLGFRGVLQVLAPRPMASPPEGAQAPAESQSSPAEASQPAHSLPSTEPGPGALPQPARPHTNGRPGTGAPSWGYLAGPDGLRPLGDWSAPEMDEAFARGTLVQHDTLPSEPRQDQDAKPARRALAVPIRLQDRMVGALDFFDDGQAGAWSDDDLALVQAVADQLGLALENARLFQEITRERERLAVLYDVLQGLMARPERDAILDTALSMAPRLGAQHAYVVLLGPRDVEVTFRGTVPGLQSLGQREARELALTLAAQGLERWVLDNRRSAIVPDTLADDRWYTTPGHVEREPARSVISVPLQTQRGSLTGVLAYTHGTPGALGEEQLPLIESIAGQVAVALENARLRQQQDAQSHSAAALARAAQAFTRTLNEADLLQIVADQLYQAYQPNGVALLRWDLTASAFTPVAVHISPDEAEADRAAWPSAGVPLPASQRPDLHAVIENRQGHIRRLQELPGDRVRQSMALPLLYGGEVEGVIEVVYTGELSSISLADMDLAVSILTAAASALQSARLYELQRQTAERLAEVDRLKSQFLANMSHELRTPLNSIIGFSRVILKGIDGPLTDVQHQDLISINSAGQHLLGLINDILDMARIEAGKMELSLDEFDLRDTIKGVLSTTIALVKDKQVALREEIAPDLPRVRADPMRVRQVLLNLLANAAKFTDRGSITLRAQAVEAVGPHSGTLEPFVELSVIDTGPGIAPEDIAKLFEPFSQVDASATRKVGGTGLGLSICRQLVELHSGRIWVESEVGTGSTFTFILPVSQPEPVPAAPAAPPADGPPARIVLAVDDDPGIVGLYRRYLEPHGYRVVGITRSGEAITRAAELRPLVVLLDVVMPNKDGWQVLAELKRSAITRDIPVLMCTLVNEPQRAYDLGAAGYLAKPILESDLLQAVSHLPGRDDGRPATVLVIEDHAEQAAFIRRALEPAARASELDLRFLEAQDGRTGLTLARNHRPQVILLDLMMPDMDGFQVLAALRQDPVTRDIPIVVVTAADLSPEQQARLLRQVVAVRHKGSLQAEDLYDDVQRVLALARV